RVSGKNACQICSVCSRNGTRENSFVASTLSNKHSSTLVACSEKIAKLTPSPVHVAPSGYGLPGQDFNVVIRREVLIDHAKRTRNRRFVCKSTKFVAEKNCQQPETNRPDNHERARRRIGYLKERLHC